MNSYQGTLPNLPVEPINSYEKLNTIESILDIIYNNRGGNV